MEEKAPKKKSTRKKSSKKKDDAVNLEELKKEVEMAKVQMTQTYFDMANQIVEAVDGMTSASLKRILKALVLYPMEVDELMDGATKTAKDTLKLATKQKDFYVEFGNVARKEVMIDDLIKQQEEAKKASKCTKKKEKNDDGQLKMD